MGLQSALNSRFGKLAFLLIDKWEPIVILLALDSKCFKNKERNCSVTQAKTNIHKVETNMQAKNLKGYELTSLSYFSFEDHVEISI